MYKRQNGSKQVAQINERVDVVRRYAKLDITHHTATTYADLKSKLAQHIQPKVNGKKPNRWPEEWQDANSGSKLGIDENDLWIAAQAKERDLTIITGDRDFELFEQFDPDIRVVYVCPPRSRSKPAKPGRSRRPV